MGLASTMAGGTDICSIQIDHIDVATASSDLEHTMLYAYKASPTTDEFRCYVSGRALFNLSLETKGLSVTTTAISSEKILQLPDNNHLMH